ncbi:NAD(P)/FAD-dependent oxidoreductase [Geodermatophilus normandii]|uniref:FAD-dependent oxidoreductase n=1 Tax=Geodermatophilus normandii TaxID=1137989 RepID=A0A6P0GFY1_9ACTN|nr:FAD-dependent oxidoreductase [Geodermatophilus normandii]NEM06178.1 FAD-dependent oxidoreductase [Geodermatophilus normandii]
MTGSPVRRRPFLRSLGRREGTAASPSGRPPRVVVVGGGFAGFHALRYLQRHLPRDAADLVLVSPNDYLLYSPLLPEVATGVVEARHVAVSLRRTLPRVRLVLGRVTDVDLTGHRITVQRADMVQRLDWDHLVLVPGSITRQFEIPGVPEHARGLKTLVEAVYLRDHLLEQLDLADAQPDTEEGRAARAEMLTVVAVGAGYTGTEFVAQAQRWLTRIERRWDRTRAQDVRWVLVDVAPAVLPELGPRLGEHALRVLRDRGVDVRLRTSVASAEDTRIVLTDGTTIGTRTLVWGAGVVASPLVMGLGLPTRRGRLVTDPDLSVPGADGLWAAGDAAAVPDLAVDEAADGQRPDTQPTAQHAQRQGVALGRNIAAALGYGTARPYRHPDLGLAADLGGLDAVARPLGIPLTGPAAKVVTRGYHLYALPAMSNRIRVALDWAFQTLLPPDETQLSVVREEDARLATAQATAIYGSTA